MTKTFTLIALCVSFFCVTNLSAVSGQFESQLVKKIEVVPGDGSATQSSFVPTTVLSRIKTREGDIFSQTEFDNDLKNLSKEYDKVEPQIESAEGNLFITLTVWSRPTIRSIRWKGNQNIETKALQEELGIKTFTVFERAPFNTAFNKLKAYYVKKGFFEADLEYLVVRDPHCNEIDIEILIHEGRSGRIKDIVFHNFTCEEQDDLLEMMVTKKWNIFLSWLNDEGIYHEEAVQQDVYQVQDYLQNEGYSDAKVFLQIEELSCDRIVLHYTADKGEMYYFGALSLEGNTLFCDDEIREFFTFEEGDPYSPEDLRETISNIIDLYGRKGYIDAIIDYEPTLEGDKHVYSIHFEFDEGEQYRVGLIRVFGNCNTQARVILHETLLVPGEIFNNDRLKLTEARLMNVGYFSTVNVYAVKTGDSCSLGKNYRDVHIEVEEKGTGSFGVTFGFSSADNVFGGFNITESNFNYKGLSHVWSKGLGALRGGGEYAYFNTTIGSKSNSYVLSWTKPYFMDTQWVVGFEAERTISRLVTTDYQIKSLGGSIFAKYQLNPFLRFGWHYRLRNSFVDVRSRGDFELAKQAKLHGLISATGVSLTYDSTDNPNFPSSGVRSVLSWEYAGLGGDHNFFSCAYINSAYLPVGKTGILKYRADFRFIDPRGNKEFVEENANDIPIGERLFLGGDDTIRGYRPYSIGPKFENGDPKGGMSLVLASMEYMRPVFSRLDAFAFADAGRLTSHTWKITGEYMVAIGYGARIKIIDGGPSLVVGMGYPLNAHRHSDVKRFFFAIGGRF